MAGGLPAAALPEPPETLASEPAAADPWEAVALALAAHGPTGTPGTDALWLAKKLSGASATGPESGEVLRSLLGITESRTLESMPQMLGLMGRPTPQATFDQLLAHNNLGFSDGRPGMAGEALSLATGSTAASGGGEDHPSHWLQLASEGLPDLAEARTWLDALLGNERTSGSSEGSFDFDDPLIQEAIQSTWLNQQPMPGMVHVPANRQDPAGLLAMLSSAPFSSSADTVAGPNLEQLPQLLTTLKPSLASADPLPPMQEFSSLTAAIEVLYDRYDERLHPGELERIAEIPASQADPLRRIISAHVFQAEVTRSAFAGLDPEAAPPMGALFRVALATAVAASTIRGAASAIPCDLTGPTEYGSSIFQYDLSCEDSYYADDAALIVDVGGDDVYSNNAGGANTGSALLVDASGNDTYDAAATKSPFVIGSATHGSGVLIDLFGSDTYTTTTGTAHAAMGAADEQGIGLLIDGSGNDVYEAVVQNTAIGAGDSGIGMLLDEAGDDMYRGRALQRWSGTIATGTGDRGTGIVVDTSGNDVYHGTTAGIYSGAIAVGAGIEGLGVLVDVAGNDTYNGTSSGNLTGAVGAATGVAGIGILYDDGGHDTYHGTAVGNLSAAVGAANGGIAVMYDRVGNDSYVAKADVAIGAASDGAAILVDSAGEDRYKAVTRQAAIGAGETGFGMLLDEAGDDSYQATASGGLVTDADIKLGAAIGAGSFGVGVMLDRAGNDTYAGEAPAAIGASKFGVGVLIDIVGHDYYNASAVAAAMGAGSVGLGVLIDGAGNDQYTAATNSDAVLQGGGATGLGLLFDAAGENHYVAAGGVAQGATQPGGTGILVDQGSNVTFRLGNNTRGQGSGVEGVGVLIRAKPDGITTYQADPGAKQGQQGAVGIGMQIDVGAIGAGSTLPTFECPGDAYVDEDMDLAAIVWRLRVCSPHDSTNRQMTEPCVNPEACPQEPLTVGDGPEGTLEKPAVPCSSIPGCAAIAELLPGEGWSDWLEREYVNLTINGGISVAYRDYVGSSAPWLLSTATPARGDDVPWCDPHCTQV